MDPRELRLPPALRFRYRLRLTGPARFHFCHGGVLRGLVSAALGRHRLPPTLVPFAPELGHVTYAAGDGYHLVVTLFGDAQALAEPLARGLARVGAEPPPGRRPAAHPRRQLRARGGRAAGAPRRRRPPGRRPHR